MTVPGSTSKMLMVLPPSGVQSLTGSYDSSTLSAHETNLLPPWAQPRVHKRGEGPTEEDLAAREEGVLWKPNPPKPGATGPSPQEMLWQSKATIIGFGGGGGGGKSDALLGLAVERHRRAVIFRREYTQLGGLFDRIREIVPATHGRLNENSAVMRLTNHGLTRLIEFGGVQHETDKDKWQGRPHDFIGFDEASQFPETVVRYLLGWLRTATPGQEVRAVLTFNPPQSAEGEWILRFFAPWIDEGYRGTKAEPGELRWYAMVDGQEIEVDDGTPFSFNGEEITPTSRTFIPARVVDNPYLMTTGYVATLQAMPEPLRSQLLFGDMRIGLRDAAWQVVPTAWIREARGRWTKDDPRQWDARGLRRPFTQQAADIAQGGKDSTTFVGHVEGWYDEVEEIPGLLLPDAAVNARLVLERIERGGVILVDADGIGAATYHLAHAKRPEQVKSYQGSRPSNARDETGLLTFINVRAAAWWAFRDALRPGSPHRIALPDDPVLAAELAAPRYKKTPRGIQIEDKADTHKRLGRSPDRADAVVMAWFNDPEQQWYDQLGKETPLNMAGPSVQEPHWAGPVAEEIAQRRRTHEDIESGMALPPGVDPSKWWT